jgi:hypothetical protein
MLVLGAAVFVAGCNSGSSKPTAIINDNNAINGDVQRLQRIEPLPTLNDSADLRIQNYYYTSEADPNKIWYLVTQALNGTPTGYYTIRGPVENVSDQVTNPTQQVCQGGSNGEKNCDAIGLAEPNGIYPGSSQDHIAILTDGAILRWEGPYQTSDQPFKVLQTPTVSINETAAISATNLSKTVGGKIPPRP